ncbi:MAG: FAD-dependent oxidoreductase [Desulfurococcales archaeon]|nr:FAD-dependent oxidoreductase [Desulfurococcales archaeon]
MGELEVDVAIIGAGVAGLSIARELSRYSVNVVVIERNVDVAQEMTSNNMGLVCQGADSLTFRPGSLHAELNIKSIPLWPKFAEELGVPFKRVGGLGLICHKADYLRFLKMYSRAFKSSLKPNAPYYIPEGSFKPLQFLDRRSLKDLEPNINPRIQGALYDPNLAVIDPVLLARSLAENAKANGVELLFGNEVKTIERKDTYFLVNTNETTVRASFVVNAAGINAESIAEMVGARNFSYVPVKGILTDFDEETSEVFSHQAFYLPRLGDPHIRAVVPIVYGGLRVGIHLDFVLRSDKNIPLQGLEHNLKVVKEVIPDYPFEKHVKRTFYGIMPLTNAEVGWHDFIVDIPEYVPKWVNVILGPAGVSSAPMLGKKVAELLMTSGLYLTPRTDFNPIVERGVKP